MKAENFYGIKAACMTFVLLSFLFNSLSATPVGMFCYRNSPDSIRDDTILVSDTMVAMSGKIRVTGCTTRYDTISYSPSVFFIIDNSSSMGGTDGSDSAGNRFILASKIIDTIMSMYPMAEVGLAVFSGGLYYNPASKPAVLQTVTTPTMGLDDTGAFIPLLTLKATYGTQTGYEILKEVLAVSNGALAYPSILENQQGCNICCGFDAAHQAFQTAIYSKDNQFIVFFSDGEANLPNGSSELFTSATNCPATFTIFFTSPDTIPSTIMKYTSNCRANCYSPTNPKSKALAYNNSMLDSLKLFFIQNVFTVISVCTVRPYSITVNGITNHFWSQSDSAFHFSSIFPLQHFVTPFNYDIVNSDNTNIKINFWVKTQQNVSLSPVTYDIRKWDRNIVFQNIAGETITACSGDLDSIQLKFDFAPGDARYNYTKVSIELFNTNTSVSDHENMLLAKGADNYFTGAIKCIIAPTAFPSNNVFEHADIDTFIAVFRNSETPKLPLDTLRITLPYQKESAIRLFDRKKQPSQNRQLIIGSYRINLNVPVEGPFTIRICDIKGAIVKLVTVKNPNLALPSALLPKKSGLYIITVATEQKRESKRVLIAR